MRYHNAHWRPQSNFCSLTTHIEAFNFVGNFEKIEAHTQMLLKAVGVWDDYGSNGWGADQNSSMFKRNQAKHQTGVCGCVCARVCVCACVRARVCVREDRIGLVGGSRVFHSRPPCPRPPSIFQAPHRPASATSCRRAPISGRSRTATTSGISSSFPTSISPRGTPGATSMPGPTTGPLTSYIYIGQ